MGGGVKEPARGGWGEGGGHGAPPTPARCLQGASLRRVRRHLGWEGDREREEGEGETEVGEGGLRRRGAAAAARSRRRAARVGGRWGERERTKRREEGARSWGD